MSKDTAPKVREPAGFVVLDLSVKVATNAWTDFSDDNDFRNERAASDKTHFSAADQTHLGHVIGLRATDLIWSVLEGSGHRESLLGFLEGVKSRVDDRIREMDAADRDWKDPR